MEGGKVKVVGARAFRLLDWVEQVAIDGHDGTRKSCIYDLVFRTYVGGVVLYFVQLIRVTK